MNISKANKTLIINIIITLFIILLVVAVFIFYRKRNKTIEPFENEFKGALHYVYVKDCKGCKKYEDKVEKNVQEWLKKTGVDYRRIDANNDNIVSTLKLKYVPVFFYKDPNSKITILFDSNESYIDKRIFDSEKFIDVLEKALKDVLIKNPEKPNPPPEKRITLPIDNPQPPPEEGIIDPIKKPERPGVPGNPPIDYVKNCKYGLEEIMTYSSEIRKDIQTIKENNEKFIKSVEKNLDYIEHAKDRVFNPDIPY